jgi:hypothetical protein
MITVNPAPKSFVSTAKKDICSDNSGPNVSTEQVVESARKIHKTFQERGYYDALKASPLYTEGSADNA